MEDFSTEIEDSYVSNYLNRFDVLILIALKRAGLHYGPRKKIITHYRKISNDRKLENEIQTFVFSHSDYNSDNYSSKDPAPPQFKRFQKLPYQQGMNNLLPIFRKYGLQKFEEMYKKYLKKLSWKHDLNDNFDFRGHLLGLAALFNNEYIKTVKSIGSYFIIMDNFQATNNRRVTSVISQCGDIISNIDVYDPDKIIKSVNLVFNDFICDKFKFNFDDGLSLFNFDTTIAICNIYSYTILEIVLNDGVDISDAILNNLKASILYHCIPQKERDTIRSGNYYIEVNNPFGGYVYSDGFFMCGLW